MIALRIMITEENRWRTSRYYSPMQITSKGQITIPFFDPQSLQSPAGGEVETATGNIKA